jgi:polysaccharide biosynthesis transport protein
MPPLPSDGKRKLPSMNPSSSGHAANGHEAPAGFGVDDAIYTVFRHKWLILAFVCLGLVGAAAVRIVRPPLYVSKAKLMVHYVLNNREMAPANPDSPRAQSVDAGAQSIMNAEIDIITSQDVATRVAETVGPARILAKKGGGTNLLAAAGVVCGGIEVDPPKSSILAISFKHPDEDVVQPVLEALIQAYILKHRGVHLMPDNYLVQQREDMRKKLTETEEELKRLKVRAKMPFPEEANRSLQRQIAKIQDQLLDAEAELLERKTMEGDQSQGAQTNVVHNAIPAEKVSSYGFVTATLDQLKRKESELLLQYKEAHPDVQNVRAQIARLNEQKADLERQCPTLRHLLVSTGQSGTNAVGTDVLIARVAALRTVLSNVQAQASQVMDMQPKIAELERLRTEEQKTYEAVVARLDQQQSPMVAGQVLNMSPVQSPTPPGLDTKKMKKLVGMVLAGCIGMGLGLAFLIDLFLDRSIKRASDIERHLHLPVFLSIPDTSWGGWLRLPSWLGGPRRGNGTAPNGISGNGAIQTGTALVPWDRVEQLQTYAEGLRERVISHFEVQNLNLKKPKLVGVTGCGDGAGVSTLASGLAAALSKTGDGNVLLVDMNVDEGIAHSFYKGKPGCGIAAALEPGNRADGQVEENLFLATLDSGGDDKLVKVLPTRFTRLMPKLKASDYDYIVFDMPPVTQTSATPRLASHLDLALLVLESEKTRHHSAMRATALMREARANVAAVLNKCRSHVPAALSQEA